MSGPRLKGGDRHPFIVDCERSAECAFCGEAPTFYKHRKPWEIPDAESQVPRCDDPEHEHSFGHDKQKKSPSTPLRKK